ncbi:hypothetical protein L9F63_011754, partial [Diploptera punctata]
KLPRQTSQFLAPYEASVKSRSGSNSPPENTINNNSRTVNFPDSHRHLGELSNTATAGGRSLSADIADWNPFEDSTPFSQMTEDHIFGAEFDKIRRGSQSSISNVKSRESLVMTYTELAEDPFSSAPFSLPGYVKTADLLISKHWVKPRSSTSSPDLETSNQDGATAALLQGATGTSPPFVRAPAEDRSKYEKLIHDHEDVSSDDSHSSQPDAGNKSQRKRHRVRSGLAAVTSRKLKKDATTPNTNPDPNYGGHLSDDSIGSASDLRAMNEDEAQGEEEDGNKNKRTGGQLNDETISESVITCGSSAYHAECESLATREEDIERRRRRKLPANETDTNERQDLLFVGHQYGDKPLLADDELDTDDECVAKSPSPSVKNSYWKHAPEEEANKGWEKNGKDSLVDVFALAPFQKPGGSTRRNSSRNSNRKISSHYQSRRRKSSLLLNSTSPLSHPITPPQDTLSLLEDRRYENVLETSFQDQETISSSDNPCSNRFENSVHFSSTVPPIAEQDEEPSDGGGSSKDLFGSSPFNSGSYAVNPFSSNTAVTTKKIVSPSNSYHETSPSVHQQPFSFSKPQSEYFIPPQKFIVQNPEMHSMESRSSLPNITANLVTPPSGIHHSIHRQTSLPHQDLFGAVPFSEMTNEILVKQAQEINLPRPTTLPLTHTSPVVDTTPSLKSNQRHSCITSHSQSCQFQGETNSSSSLDIIHKTNSDTSPKLHHRKEKTRSADNSKYHLIEDCHENIMEKTHVLPTKLTHKTGKMAASSSFKKASKGSKKVGNDKASKVAAASFSNMSFEDFPSDEGDDPLTEQVVVPFEVIRDEKQSHEGEKKFGSLKRRSNPFS